MSHLLIYKYLDVIHLSQVIDFYQNLSIIIIVRGREKNFPENKKFLTNSKISDIINTKSGRKTAQTRKVNVMKKLSLETIYSFLSDNGFAEDYSEIMDELRKEITKGDAQKAKNAEEYVAVKPIIFGALTDTPVTIGELYEEIKNSLPEGFSKSKVQYAITRRWADEVTKTEGKVNTYSRKA